MSTIWDKIKSIFKSKDEFEIQEPQSKPLIFNNDLSNPQNIDFSRPSFNQQNETTTSTNETMEKVKDFVQGTSDEIVEQGTALWDAVKEKVQVLDDSTQEFRDQIKVKATETIEKIEQYVNTTVEKAKKLEEEDNLIDKDQDGIADKPIDFGQPIGEQHSVLFDKADAWLKKQESSQPSVEKDTPQSTKTITPLELPKEE